MQQNGDQPVDLLGDLDPAFTGQNFSNGIDKHVSFDQESGIGLPNPSDFYQGDIQGQVQGEGQSLGFAQRNMSEGEILGYQNEYGGSVITGQSEYLDDNGVNDGTDIDQIGQGQYTIGQGQYTDPYLEGDSQVVPQGDLMDNYNNQSVDPSQNFYEENFENDYLDTEGAQGQGDYPDENVDANSWQPEMDTERSRRSGSPERSISPNGEGQETWQPELNTEGSQRSASQEPSMSPEMEGECYGAFLGPPEMDPERARRSHSPERSLSPPRHTDSQGDTENDSTFMSQPQVDSERSRRSVTPERSMSPGGNERTESVGEVESDMISSPTETSDSQATGCASESVSTIPVESQMSEQKSQGSVPLSSETESLDSRSETEGTPKKSKMKIPKPKVKKPLELPPWNDNVVIPPPPRMKPTMIGKNADLPPPAPQSPRRPKTAPAQHTAKG